MLRCCVPGAQRNKNIYSQRRKARRLEGAIAWTFEWISAYTLTTSLRTEEEKPRQSFGFLAHYDTPTLATSSLMSRVAC